MSAGDPSTRTRELSVLDRDLTRFLVDLSIALHRFAMYPPAHPALSLALDTLGRHLDTLLQNRPRIAIGVARDRLVAEGVVTDGRQPLLSSLAGRLHRHQFSALAFCPGTTIDEHQPVEAYDQVIVGYLQQIADETRTARTPEVTELRRWVSTLVSSMYPDTLRHPAGPVRGARLTVPASLSRAVPCGGARFLAS